MRTEAIIFCSGNNKAQLFKLMSLATLYIRVPMGTPNPARVFFPTIDRDRVMSASVTQFLAQCSTNYSIMGLHFGDTLKTEWHVAFTNWMNPRVVWLLVEGHRVGDASVQASLPFSLMLTSSGKLGDHLDIFRLTLDGTPTTDGFDLWLTISLK